MVLGGVCSYHHRRDGFEKGKERWYFELRGLEYGTPWLEWYTLWHIFGGIRAFMGIQTG